LLITNLVLDVLLLVLVYAVGRRLASPATGLFAVLLYLLVPLIPRELFISGSTDIAAVVFLLASILFFGKRPLLAGFLIGASLATKPFPGLFFALSFFPHAGRRHYVGGVLLGMIPMIVFLVASPGAFVANTLLFGTVIRSVDPTSWQYGLWRPLGVVAGGLFFGALVAAAAYVLLRRPTVIVRLSLYVALVIGALLSGPVNHGNYQIWWIPFLVVLVAVVVSRRWGR